MFTIINDSEKSYVVDEDNIVVFEGTEEAAHIEADALNSGENSNAYAY